MKRTLLLLSLASVIFAMPARALDESAVASLKWTSVSTLTPTKTKVGFFDFERGKLTVEGEALKVKNVPVRDGLLAHAPSLAVFDIGGQGYTALRGKAALRDDAWGEVKFKILGDGKLLWESPVVKKETKQRPAKVEEFLVDVTGVSKLEFIVDELGSANSDHSVWVKPELGK